jgi:predicted PurR-regulated permease PerM/methanogenic corrinoid protein MtbC1
MREAASEHAPAPRTFRVAAEYTRLRNKFPDWQHASQEQHPRGAMSRISSLAAARTLSQLLAVIVTVAVITTLYLAKTVILPLALALLLSFVLAPLVTALEQIRLPRIVAIPIVILLAGGALGAVGWTVMVQLVEVTDALPAYTTNIHDKLQAVHRSKTTSFTRAQQELDSLSKQLGDLSSEFTGGELPGRQELGSSPAHPVSVREVGGSQGRLDAISGKLGVVVSAVLVVVFTFFMLLKREDLRNRLIQLSGHGHLYLVTQALDDASRRVSRYLSLQWLVNTTFGLIVFVVLHLLNLPHALLFGALAGLLRFIPYIGAPIGALLPTALSLAVYNGWTKTVLILAIFFCMEIATANLIEPQVYGKHTGLSSLAILVAAIFWALIWGPIGLVLSVPLTVCLVVVGAHVPNLQFLAVLLGDQPVMPPEAHYYQRLLANDQREASQVLETQLKGASLEDLYDKVLIPALQLAEQDRHRNELDDSTVAFITQTTKDLVEELSLRQDDSKPEVVVERNADPRVLCLPVRDDADEIVGIMLAQLLERAGYAATAIPIGSVEGMLAEVARTNPEVVCLSALPPYAISHARGIYRRLRAQHSKAKIIIGLWSYTEDPVKAGGEVSGGEQNLICTTLAQMTLQVSLALGTPLKRVPSLSPN